MDAEQFHGYAKSIVEYMTRYLDNIRKRPVLPKVKPNYLVDIIPKEAPQKAGNFDQVIEDIDTKIMKGIVHWQHTQFHGYFPMGNSYPSVLADIISTLIGIVGFSWASCPACTELELIMLDWIAKVIGLPKEFLFYSEGTKGAGGLQCTTSECIMVCMLAARAQVFKNIKEKENTPDAKNNTLLSRIVAYASSEAHSSVERAAMICMVKLRTLASDDKCELQGDVLEKAVKEDINKGLVPFFVLGTLGTTTVCSFDNIESIGLVCKKYPTIWFHVDGSYAGNAFICPELRKYSKGIEYADSFNMNPYNWMKMSFDGACMWVKNLMKFEEGLVVDPLYLLHQHSGGVIDYRHWTVSLSRRFRSLKIWFTLRTFGIEGIQDYIRNHCKLAKYFESLVIKDPRFEIMNDVRLGLVCFRLKGTDEQNKQLVTLCTASRAVYVIPATVKGKYIIRMCLTAADINQEDINKSWSIIQIHAAEVLENPSG